MNLLDEITSDLVNEKVTLTNTLRKAKILASQLQLQEFKDWVKNELEGYTHSEAIPDYRRFEATNIGTFSGPFQSMARNVTLPTYNLPEEIQDFAKNMHISESFAELEGMLSCEGDALNKAWSQEAIILSRESVKMSGGMVLVDAYQPFPKYRIEGILDNVKNKLMDFILDLKASNIPLNPEHLEPGRKEQIRNSFNVHIYGNHNIVAGGEGVIQSNRTIIKNDILSLQDYFKTLEVPPEDLTSLENAVKADGKTKKEQLGKNVKEWMGNMVSKASRGLWKVGLEVAPKLIVEALKSYYGW